MESTVIEFEWDHEKSLSNEKKHGVGFPEASTVFGDPLELTITDPGHSLGEYRFVSVGRSRSGRLLVVAFSERAQNRIRIISAREATRRERSSYEQDHQV